MSANRIVAVAAFFLLLLLLKKLPYLNLQLLGFGVVDEEGEGFLPHWFIGLIPGLEKDTTEGRQKEDVQRRLFDF